MSNSSLVTVTKISPHSSPRTAKIDTVTIHHMAAVTSGEACAVEFQRAERRASANYCIGNEGDVALSVEESRRAWTSSSRDNDNRAVTIEVSNSARGGDWPVGDAAMEKLVELCADICQRNGIPALNYTGDKTGNLTLHKWFAATLCPGPYLESKMPWIAREVNRRLGAAKEEPETGILYRVQVGAFRIKANAEKQLEKLKNQGYTDAFITESGGDSHG